MCARVCVCVVQIKFLLSCRLREPLSCRLHEPHPRLLRVRHRDSDQNERARTSAYGQHGYVACMTLGRARLLSVQDEVRK